MRGFKVLEPHCFLALFYFFYTKKINRKLTFMYLFDLTMSNIKSEALSQKCQKIWKCCNAIIKIRRFDNVAKRFLQEDMAVIDLTNLYLYSVVCLQEFLVDFAGKIYKKFCIGRFVIYLKCEILIINNWNKCIKKSDGMVNLFFYRKFNVRILILKLPDVSNKDALLIRKILLRSAINKCNKEL